MEVTIAMGHFCDTHGPCVILCTDRESKVPKEPPPSLDVPVCNACRSIEVDTVYACQDDNSYYVSTRTSLNVTVASQLKDAVLRSLSVEVVQEKCKDSGTMYFGDNTRGHVVSHVFDLKDSLARGFKRKYCIIILGKHQIPLLHHYDFIEKNLVRISADLQIKADIVNAREQSEKSQREVRQTQGCSKPIQRSLAQLVGERRVFAHLHMWFVFLLRAKVFKNVPHNINISPVSCPTAKELRQLRKEMPESVFKTITYCTLTGIKLKEASSDCCKHFRQLLPTGFVSPTLGQTCKVSQSQGGWQVQFKGTLPNALPRLYVAIESALNNEDLPDSALAPHLMSLVMRWFNIACVIGWAPDPCEQLMHALEVRKCDMPLLAYWVPQSNAHVELCRNDWFKKFQDAQLLPS